jgi:hypothetical protein
MRFKAVTLGFVLASTALGSAALSLGRARGAAWIGQSLELVVPVQIDTGQADGALCAEADVFHGDSRQDNSRVQVQVEPTGQPDTFNLRILSSALIDEPVVTVYLRAGCTQKSSRKYVLLADFPNVNVAQQSQQIPPPPVPTVAPANTSANPTLPNSGNPQVTPAAASKNSNPATAAVTKPAVSTAVKPAPKTPAPTKKVDSKSAKAENPVASPLTQTKPASAGQSRLRLDPVDTLSERIKSLETTNGPNAGQEEMARDNQKMQQLQADLRSLLDQAAKNEASLALMRERLERAESDRVPLAMVYALIALLLTCFAALAYFVGKGSRVARRSTASKRGNQHGAVPVDTSTPQPSEAEVAHSPVEDIDVNLLDLDESSFSEIMGDQAGNVAVTTTRHHNFNADALVDIRQQAEFLAKLGKVDAALEVLEGGIRANPAESPLLFLDLLVVANNFSRKTDFRQFSAEFAQLFNATVPEFALFRDEGRKLETYPALREHIHSQWESPQVLDVIEACILRDPEASESAPFDLAAFRDLLALHASAREHHQAHTTSP